MFNEKITSSKRFLDLTDTEKLTLVQSNREIRRELKRKSAVRKSKKTKTSKKKQKKLTFKSKELEQIFNSMSEECKQLILKGK